ncbi:hypothetical protein HPB48_008548 [Haemaphysalis longicornis]|uniref:Uncharacterized protein n=1 Tax=Haemaphysalis longicornis TaxID=44386 RepID=A0A9J6FCN4_HAELO|nr:hypothetical protein HPB48_008548 [Haemaphysalis longicornis]
MHAFVRVSLHFGLPMLWAFYDSRHPIRPFKNTIFMKLGKHVRYCIADMGPLKARGWQAVHVRRCAEVDGGGVQLNSPIIADVLSTHATLVELIGSSSFTTPSQAFGAISAFGER